MHPLRNDIFELGQVGEWKQKSFPQAYMVGENANMSRASRVYEMLKDHPIGDGSPLEFPIMGHPFPILVGRQNNAASMLKFTTASYPGGYLPASELMKASFVNWQGVDMDCYIRNQRVARLGINDVTSKAELGLLNGAFNYTVNNDALMPTYESNKIKCDDVTSSHCAIIHVPPVIKSDGKNDPTCCICDVTIETVVEVDISKVTFI